MNARTNIPRGGKPSKVRFEHLPPAIADKLKQSVARVKRILWMRGLMATGATALIAILVIMGIDAAVVIYSDWVRWALTLSALAVTGLAAVRMLFRPLSRPFTPARIAAIIEQRHPELEERLSTVVELLSGSGDHRGSEQLFNVLTHEAEADAKDVAPDQEFTTRTVKPKLVAAAVALGIFGLLFAAWPGHTGRLFARAVAPYAAIDNLYADNFVVAPGDHILLTDDPLEILLTVSGGFPGQAYVRRETVDARGRRREVRERMRQVASPEGTSGVRSFRLLFPSVEESFRYRVSCGHGLTRFYTVTALDRPAVSSLQLRYVYPAYTGRAPRVQDGGIADIEGVPGTRVELSASLNRPGLKSLLSLSSQELEGTSADNGRTQSWNFEIERDLATRWGILLTDTHGFTNLPSFYSVKAVPDQVPTILLTRPEVTRLKLPPYAKVVLEFTAMDDFGLVVPDLLMARGSDPLTVLRPVRTFESTGPGVWRGSETVDLASMALGGVSELKLQIEVTDNLPPDLGGPQAARTATVVIELDHASLSLESQALQDQAANVEKTLQEVVERLKDAEKAAAELAEKIAKEEPLTESDQQKLDEIRKDAALAEELTRKLAEETEDTAFDPITEKLEKLQEEHLTPAREQAEEAQLANPEEQPAEIAELQEKLEEALKAAEDVLKETQDFAEKLEQVAAMDELAMKEQALADAAAMEMTPEQIEEWMAMQEALAQELKEMLAQNPEALMDELEKRQEALAELAQETKSLAEEQQELRQLTEELGHPESREQAAEALEQQAPEAPQDATPEQRAAELEQQIAEKAADLAERTEELMQDIQEFGEPTAPLTQPFEQAAQELAKAEEKASDAAEALQNPPPPPPEGQPPPPAPEALQQEAQTALEKASEALEKTQEAMGEMMEQLAEAAAAMAEAGEPLMPAEAMQEALGMMEESLAGAEEAAQAPPEDGPPGPPEDGPPGPPEPAPPGPPMQQAAEKAAEAAQMLQQMAQQAAEQLGIPLPALPSQMMTPSEALGEMQRAAAAAALQPTMALPDALRGKMTEEEWFRMRGEIRSGAMEDAFRSVPPEYRELVRMYFQELSRQQR